MKQRVIEHTRNGAVYYTAQYHWFWWRTYEEFDVDCSGLFHGYYPIEFNSSDDAAEFLKKRKDKWRVI